MKHLIRFLALAQIGLLVLILTLLCSLAAEASDGVYACWKVDGELVMSGYFHPAAVAGGPLGGPGLGLTIELGEGCDQRVGSEPGYVLSPTLTPTPTSTATPTPLPTAVPTPTPAATSAPSTCMWRVWLRTYDEHGYYRIVTEDDWKDC